MIRINLLGDVFALAGGKKPDKGEVLQIYGQEGDAGRPSLPIAGLVVGCLIAGLSGLYWIQLARSVDQQEQRNAELERRKNELEKYAKLEQTYRTQKEALQKKKEVMMGLKRLQHLPVHFLEELANAVPEDVWFKELTQKDMAVTINGESRSFEAINQFLSRLQDQKKWLQNVNYPKGEKKGQVIEFTISFELKNAVGGGA